MVCVFDLDGTLAELGQAVRDEDRALLLKLAENHVIVLCSGKPVGYLCGFARQLGLPRSILVGENGATFQFGVDLPPKEKYWMPISLEAKTNLARIRSLLNARFGEDMWYQANEICLTPFPKNEEEFATIEAILAEHPDCLQGLQYYRHCDSYDFAPLEVNKGSAMAFLSHLLGVGAEEFAAVGDGVNDGPMLAFAGCALGVHYPDATAVDYNFPTVTEALRFLLERDAMKE